MVTYFRRLVVGEMETHGQMTARVGNHRSPTRTPLNEVLPLRTPFRLHVEVTNHCNFRCIFCPPYDERRTEEIPRKHMSFEFFQKLVDDMALFPDPLKKLYCHNFGEPLLNRDLPRMIAYAKAKGVVENIELLTNGALLEPGVNRQLIDAGLDHLCVSVEALDEAGYMSIARSRLDYPRFLSGIRDFFENRRDCTVHVKIADIGLKDDADRDRFYELFGRCCDSIFVENIVDQDEGYHYERLKAVKTSFEKGQYQDSLQEISVCPSIFYMLVVNSDGSVSPCCVDWRRDIVVGDANRQSLPEIWQGKPLQDLRLLHLSGKRSSHPVCANCNFLKYSTDPRDIIDGHASALAQTFQAVPSAGTL